MHVACTLPMQKGEEGRLTLPLTLIGRIVHQVRLHSCRFREEKVGGREGCISTVMERLTISTNASGHNMHDAPTVRRALSGQCPAAALVLNSQLRWQILTSQACSKPRAEQHTNDKTTLGHCPL
jgi:hypothetical protein